MRDTSNLSPRMHVHIRAFDDTPSHQFLVEEVFEGCITGTAVTGPLAGEYGEPDVELVLRVLSPDSSGSSQGTAYTLSLVVITKKIIIIRAKWGYRPGRKRHVDTD